MTDDDVLLVWTIIHRSGRWWKWGRPRRIHLMNDVRWTQGGCRRVGPVVDSVCPWWVHHSFGKVWDFTVAWDPGCCRQLHSTMFKFSCGWAPPPLRPLDVTDMWWILPGFPVFTALLLLCIVVNANQRMKNRVTIGLGTKLLFSCMLATSTNQSPTPIQSCLDNRHYGEGIMGNYCTLHV